VPSGAVAENQIIEQLGQHGNVEEMFPHLFTKPEATEVPALRLPESGGTSVSYSRDSEEKNCHRLRGG